MSLAPFLHRRLMFVAPPVRTRGELFQLLARAASPLLDARPPEDLTALLDARESQQSTVLTEGVAFPHAIAPGIPRTLVGAVRAQPPVVFDPERPAVQLCFVLFGDSATPWVHVRTLARLARLVHQAPVRTRLEEATSPAALLERLREEDARHA